MEETTRSLKEVLRTVLEEQELDPNSKQEIEKISAHLLLSCLYRVTVYCEGLMDSGKKFIVKTLRQDPVLNDKFDTRLFFENESLFYNMLLECFNVLQDVYLGGRYESFQSAPKCFKAINNDEFSIIVLEDLAERGYKESSRFKSLSLHELSLLMKELGRFHALSLFVKHKKQNLFSAFKDLFKDPTYRKEFMGKTFNAWASSVASWTVNLAKFRFQPNSKYMEKLQAFATARMGYTMLDVVRPKQEDEDYNVFNHGDLWVNNLLFHYPDAESEAANEPDKMCFIDFQQCRYGSIGLDLSSVFFLLMDHDVRENHGEELLGVYYSSLCEFLSQLGYDSAKIFRYSAVKSQLEKYAQFGIAMSFLCLSYNLVNDNEDDIQDDGRYVRETTDDCRKRILDVIEESVDLGYL